MDRLVVSTWYHHQQQVGTGTAGSLLTSELVVVVVVGSTYKPGTAQFVSFEITRRRWKFLGWVVFDEKLKGL